MEVTGVEPVSFDLYNRTSTHLAFVLRVQQNLDRGNQFCLRTSSVVFDLFEPEQTDEAFLQTEQFELLAGFKDRIVLQSIKQQEQTSHHCVRMQ